MGVVRMAGKEKKRLFSQWVWVAILLSCAVVLHPFSAEAALKAEVDRDKIALDETLTLTISRDGAGFFSSPDSKALEKDFRVVSTSRSSNTQFVNGQMSATVRWEIVLSPKRLGKLEIPALEVGGERSEPIWVQVEKTAPVKKSTDSEETIFIETEVDHDELRVQSQLIYTIRVFFSIQAQIQDPQTPDIPDALVEKLEDATFNKTLQGKTYKVFERKYAIFPQRSGVLEIPQTSLQITVPSGRRFGGVFDFMDRGRTYQLRGKSHSVKVLEKASEFPANSVWLPSENLTIEEKWSRDPDALKVGESVTLTVDTFGDGLLAEQLPPVVIPEIAGIKVYQNKAETDNNISTHGIVGHRAETIALIPTQPGTFSLPDFKIAWWDKKNNQVEYAVIPSRKLTVTGSPVHDEPEMVQMPRPTLPVDKETATSPAPLHQEDHSRIWRMVSAVLAFLFLTTLILFLRARQKLVQLEKTTLQGTSSDRIEAVAEKKLFDALRRACKKNEPHQVRRAVLDWADAYWTERPIRTASDIAAVAPGNDLAKRIGSLDSFLYGKEKEPEQWDAAGLLEAVIETRKSRGEKNNRREALSPLYK